MTDRRATTGRLPVYRVRARNTSVESENKIHDDRVAAEYGFRGGLVPGVTVYAYMTVPIVEAFGLRWLESGSMQVKFHQPFYEGERLSVHTEVEGDGEPVRIAVRAERDDGTVCATALATVDDQAAWLGEARIGDYPKAPLPAYETRPVASRDSIVVGALLGTLKERIDLADAGPLGMLDERLGVYYGAEAVAHPFTLLGFANKALMDNYRLGPWIHAASDLINWSAARDGEEISVRGRVGDRFERKGHEFVVLDLLLVAEENRVVQQVRHTAIYRPRAKSN